MGTERGGDLKAPKDGDCDTLIIGDLAGVKPGGNDDGDAIAGLPCLPRRGPASVKEVAKFAEDPFYNSAVVMAAPFRCWWELF